MLLRSFGFIGIFVAGHKARVVLRLTVHLGSILPWLSIMSVCLQAPGNSSQGHYGEVPADH